METITYVGLLRGINVGKHRRMKMEDLRACLSGLGLESVQTYIQSGNFVCQSTQKKSEVLSQIETAIVNTFNFKVPVWLYTAKEWTAFYTGNPWVSTSTKETLKTLHLTLFQEAISSNTLGEMENISKKADAFVPTSGGLYLKCTHGYAKSPFHHSAIERTLNVTATTRNWRTVEKLYTLIK